MKFISNFFLVVMPCLTAFLHNGGYLFNRSTRISLTPNEKEAAKAEQFRIQQEMLARRKNKGAMKNYFESVEERRKETWKETNKNNWREEKNDVDPLEKWKNALKSGQIKGVGYEPEPSRKDSKLGLNIIIPVNPIGIPKYDEGERFDLRLPYAERGYEDADADVLGKLGNGISSFFGLNKNAKKNLESDSKKTDKTGKK